MWDLVAVYQQIYPCGVWDHSISSKSSIWFSFCRWKWSHTLNSALRLYPGNTNWNVCPKLRLTKKVSLFQLFYNFFFLQKQIPEHLSLALRVLFFQYKGICSTVKKSGMKPTIFSRKSPEWESGRDLEIR